MSAAGRVVVVTGATGETGRAVSAALTAAGATVVAVGTDAARLASVDAAHRVVADLADAASVSAAAAALAHELPAVDGLIHLVGGWRGGDDAETRAWLDERLVDTLENTVDAFGPALAASSSARLAIVGSTAVTDAVARGEEPAKSAYSRAKLAAEGIVWDADARWLTGDDSAALVWLVRAIGNGEKDTPPSAIAAAAVALWDSPATALDGHRIRP